MLVPLKALSDRDFAFWRYLIPIQLGDATNEIGGMTAQMGRLPYKAFFKPKLPI